MAVVFDAIVGVERHIDVWQMRVLDDALPQLALLFIFRFELRHDDERNGAARPRQLYSRRENFTRDCGSPLDGVLAAISEHPSCDRRQAPLPYRRQPDQ